MLSIDSHCHPQFPQYDSDRQEVIKRAQNEDIGMVCVGTDLEMSKKAIELAENYEVPILPPQSGDAKSRIRDVATVRGTGNIGSIWASVGVHPNDLEQNHELGIMNYGELLNHPKVVALGEVGLDYYRTREPKKKELQRQIFKKFLDLALELNKPLIIHSRDAFQDTFDILNSYFMIHNSKLRGVIHSFTYSFNEAQEFFDLGFYIGLNGIITFTEQYNDTVLNAPLDRILLETDAPFLAPVPNRGKRNEPLWVKFVAEHLSKIRGVSVEEVNKITLENTKNLFGI